METREEKAGNGGSVTEESDTEDGMKEAGNIRVLLMTTDYQSYFHPRVTVLRDGKEIVCSFENMAASEEPVVIPAHENGIQLTSIQRQCGNPVYQGSLEIQRTDQGFTVINELPLETYLEAVVPSEMPSGYQKEALKAQAVCARTYAWKQMQEGRLSKYGADVDDSVNYQVYQNIAPQQATSEAVRETEGKILCQNGKPVQAYYFSTSSGVTSTDEIWGAEEPAPYLKSVDCGFGFGRTVEPVGDRDPLENAGKARTGNPGSFRKASRCFCFQNKSERRCNRASGKYRKRRFSG